MKTGIIDSLIVEMAEDSTTKLNESQDFYTQDDIENFEDELFEDEFGDEDFEDDELFEDEFGDEDFEDDELRTTCKTTSSTKNSAG